MGGDNLGRSYNQVYNGNLQLARLPGDRFPDGWKKTGGSGATQWKWIQHNSDFGIEIKNTNSGRAGIRQGKSVFIKVGEKQRWQVYATIFTPWAGRKVYLRVRLYKSGGGSLGVLEQNFLTTKGNSKYKFIVPTPAGTAIMQIEAGIRGNGTLIIKKVYSRRLYPYNRLKLDSKGRISVADVGVVKKIEEPVTVTGSISVDVHADVEADIRSLDYSRDSVTVYGSQNTPLKTNSAGLLQVEAAGALFIGDKEQVVTEDPFRFTVERDVSGLKQYTYAVLNTSSAPAAVRIDISPDSIFWVWDGPEDTLVPGEMRGLVARCFLRYIRIGFRSLTPGNTTTLNIWFQGQS